MKGTGGMGRQFRGCSEIKTEIDHRTEGSEDCYLRSLYGCSMGVVRQTLGREGPGGPLLCVLSCSSRAGKNSEIHAVSICPMHNVHASSITYIIF